MDRSRLPVFDRLVAARSRIFAPVPPEIRRIWLFCAVALLPIWGLIWSSDTGSWDYAAMQLHAGESIYRPLLTNPNGEVAAHYPYLPSFGVLIGILSVPFYLLERLGLPFIAYHGATKLVAGSFGYLSLLVLPVVASHLLETAEKRFWACLIVLLLPGLWFRVGASGPDLFVTVLALFSVLAVERERWLLAGFFAGSAMFKFTGIPFGPGLAAYAVVVGGRSALWSVAGGGVLSQLPNALYFLVFPADLWLFVEHRTLSWHAGDLGGFLLEPVAQAGLVEWYETVGFPVVLAVFCLGAVLVAVSRRDLVAAYCVGYVATGILPPTPEQRVITLQLLVLLGLIAADRRVSRYLLGWLLLYFVYPPLLSLLDTGFVTNLAADIGLFGLFFRTGHLAVLVMVGALVVWSPFEAAPDEPSA